MKTSKIFMTTLVALTMAACSNDNDWVDQSSNPDVIAPDAYASFSINIPHASKTRAVSTDPGIAAENTVKSLHVFIYDAESPNTPTVAEFINHNKYNFFFLDLQMLLKVVFGCVQGRRRMSRLYTLAHIRELPFLCV